LSARSYAGDPGADYRQHDPDLVDRLDKISPRGAVVLVTDLGPSLLAAPARNRDATAGRLERFTGGSPLVCGGFRLEMDDDLCRRPSGLPVPSSKRIV